MSFLLAEENEDATLQEALAFIDAWDTSPATEEGASSGTKRRRGERRRVHDVRRRLRKKEEMLELRQQAEQLQYQLAQLQHPDSLLRDVVMTPCSNYTDGDDTESNSSSSPPRGEETSLGLVDKKRRTESASPREGRRWQMTAAAVRQERLEAELLNMTLRKAVASELKVTKALNSVLDKRPRQGVGRQLCNDGASEKQFTVELGAPGKALILEGFGSVHKHYEDDRLLITWAAMSFDRCGALCFRECAWILATRSPSNPAQASVVRTHYTLVADKALGCTDIEGEAIDRVRNRALRAIGVQIRDRHSKLQQNFLKKTGQEELAGFTCS
ncbi:hypothetical protein BBJ28_00008037 [Nothophytophthora sp. Chile5]|nr:hypothetical protein BBJ28_00008037 [Nothophytophthora sp. Chile5]